MTDREADVAAADDEGVEGIGAVDYDLLLIASATWPAAITLSSLSSRPILSN